MFPYKTHTVLITGCAISHVTDFVKSDPRNVYSKSLLQEGENRKKQIAVPKNHAYSIMQTVTESTKQGEINVK